MSNLRYVQFGDVARRNMQFCAGDSLQILLRLVPGKACRAKDEVLVPTTSITARLV